jgi:methylmalonyl-CoA/ethylmalonyl-CoA epimerase
MFTQIDHIGIAVHNLEEAVGLYQRAFGVQEWEYAELSDRHMRVAIAHVGESLIELITPTSEEAAFAKFLRERGQGTHHIAYRVDDIKAALEQLRNEGVQLIDQEPRPGLHNTQVAFIHPKAALGVLIELVQH